MVVDILGVRAVLSRPVDMSVGQKERSADGLFILEHSGRECWSARRVQMPVLCPMFALARSTRSEAGTGNGM